MIEVYAFFAAFVVQIFATSLLYPTFFIRYWRGLTTNLPAERLEQLYPGVDLHLAQQRILSRYRALSIGIAVLGLLLLVWLFGYMRRPEWNDGPVEALVSGYFLLQMGVPLGLVIWLGLRFHKAHKQPVVESKRKAVLQRRGLFDFISPVAVVAAFVSYVLFAAYVLYLRNHPFPGFAGLVNLGAMTVIYALNSLVVYAMLYGKKANPLETHAGRLRTIGLVVKSAVYTCIACVVFVSLNFTLILLDWQRWEPFVLSVYFVIMALLSLMGMTAPPRQSEADAVT
ncbi:hypothetical protein JM946_23995 [Steroidobacter sp. S1-65]|uniref:DUF4013 domain-containing protein n=1 Tax=Steroidobacter gossypii TaxID=2805490 RepID=A0ABS1X3K6_9GAMM|nr:hypothetical protein [Steroidobacter gossypii]MBM0107809.1 hypothetical protein [Steroidobacter gossypii]